MMGLKLKSFNFNFQMEKNLEYSCMERIKSAQIALFLRERLKEKWKKKENKTTLRFLELIKKSLEYKVEKYFNVINLYFKY